MSRFDYVAYDDISNNKQIEAKIAVTEIERIINTLPPGRPSSLALTALEEVYMWIGKSIRDAQISRNSETVVNERRADS